MSDSISINKGHFDKIASEYDKRFEGTLAQLEIEIRARRELIGMKQGGRLLDYACGTGLLSRSFNDQASQCVGIDLSESMVEAYNAKAKIEGLYPDTRQAHQGNLLSGEQDSRFAAPEFFDFDMAGVGLGFHHFDHPEQATQRLVSRLRTGGVLFILDFMPHSHGEGHGHGHGHGHDHGHDHDHDHGHGHHTDDVDASHASHGVVHAGFSEDRIKSMFEAAGAGGDFQFQECAEPLVMKDALGERKDLVRRIFVARGTKL